MKAFLTSLPLNITAFGGSTGEFMGKKVEWNIILTPSQVGK